MIRDDAVHEELKLSEQQKSRVLSALRGVDGPWFRSRNLDLRTREAEIRKLRGQLDAKMAGHSKCFPAKTVASVAVPGFRDSHAVARRCCDKSRALEATA